MTGQDKTSQNTTGTITTTKTTEQNKKPTHITSHTYNDRMSHTFNSPSKRESERERTESGSRIDNIVVIIY